MSEPVKILIAVCLFLLLGGVLILLSRRRGLPEGSVIYEDLIRGGEPAGTLFSARYGLSGKPDMIIRQGRQLIPVEIKHAPGGSHPRPSHVLQLAAYCLLIEEHYGVRPASGIIRYRDRQFEVPFTADLEASLLRTMAEMRAQNPTAMLPPLCRNRNKCRHCAHAGICEETERRERP